MAFDQAKYKAEYEKQNYKQIKFNLNVKSDRDIIAQLEAVDNKQAYIKDLIRKDIK